MRSLAFFISAFGASLLSACAAGAEGPDAIQTQILSDFDTVDQLSPEAYLALNPEKTLILDIREPEEYAVSRLPGAIWVSPDIDAESALIQIGNVQDKEIVVYCSVGVRSSRFAARVQDQFKKMGAVSVSNLEHGIFGWHNDRRSLENARGQTDAVHPYDKHWARYVKRQDRVQYRAE